MRPGKPHRVDDKYEQHGTRSLFMFYNPIYRWRGIGCHDSRNRRDWAEGMKHLLDVDYPQAETVTLVLDNLNTHDFASLYFTFDAQTASRLSETIASGLYSEERQLAERGRNGTEYPLATMPWSATLRNHRRPGLNNPRLASTAKQTQVRNQLAIHHCRRPNQTQSPIPQA